MLNVKDKPKLARSILAIVVVFLMSAGAFIGAAETVRNDDTSESIGTTLPAYPMAGPTDESALEPESYKNVESEEDIQQNNDEYYDYDFTSAEIPHGESENYPEQEPQEILNELPKDFEQVIDPDYLDFKKQNTESEIMEAMDRNTISEGLSYITTQDDSRPRSKENAKVIDETSASYSSSLANSLTITFGTDNSKYTGQGTGYLYNYRTSYSTSYYYYMYPYGRKSGYTGTRRRGWAVFDLSDLNQFDGVSISSGKIVYRQDYRYRATQMDFWTMKTVPYGSASSTVARNLYNEVGGAGSVKLGSATFSGSSDSGNKDITTTISSGGITWFNNQISASNFDIPIGSDISKFYSTYYYGYIRAYDVRLELTFTYTSISVENGELAIGDELSGYCSSSSLNDFGRIYTSTSYRAYATWDVSDLKAAIPNKDPMGNPVEITGVNLRLNNHYSTCYLNTLGLYHMKTNPKGASASTIYSDARDGTLYTTLTVTTRYTSPIEFEWELGDDALSDLKNALSGTPNFFAIGFSRTSNYAYYMGSPKLVVKFKVKLPPLKMLQMGADNPQYGGEALGYTTKVGTAYSSLTSYYSFISFSSTTDYRGWAVFDIQDLTKWDGMVAKRAKLLIHNWKMDYINEINFTLLSTTPYNTIGSTVAQNVFTQSGPTGTLIGQYVTSKLIDHTPKTLEIDLNSAALTSINNKVKSSPTYYTFAVGMYVSKLHSGYTYGSAYWTDIRLSVKFEFDNETMPTTAGNGLAFGDDWSGFVEQFTAYTNYEYGYWEINKSLRHRGYAHWDIGKIRGAFAQDNISFIKINKIALRFNHFTGLLTNLSVYHMKNNVTQSVTADKIYTDCGDGDIYYSRKGMGGPSSGTEVEWELNNKAVTAFRDAFEDKNPDFFGVGIIADLPWSSKCYDYSPKLVIEWSYNFLMPILLEPIEGNEGIPTFFNADKSRNTTGEGIGGLRFEWDWDNDGVFDEVSTSPYTNHTWNDDWLGKITLRVNDTNTGGNTSKEFKVLIHNVDPKINPAKGKVTPQPTWEAKNVTFSEFEVVDPGLDVWSYFWDFNGDGEYDLNGSCDKNKIPNATWYYGDDFLGEVELLVVDEDGGTSNTSIPHKAKAQSNSGWTGYVTNAGAKTAANTIYVRWDSAFDYYRGWAKLDFSDIPDDAIIKKVEFVGYVEQNISVNFVGAHILSSDPTTALGSTVYSEAGSSSNRVFGLTWTIGEKRVNLTKFVKTIPGKKVVDDALKNDWIAFGFDFESPTTASRNYGYMRGSAYNLPNLEIDYVTYEPGYLIPMTVENMPPKINCSNLTISPTTLNEGEIVGVNNITFYDPGNDTYEYNIVIGDIFSTGWQPLGEKPVPGGGGGGIVINEICTDGGEDFVELYNYGPTQDMTNWILYCDEYPSQGLTKYTFPKFTLNSRSFVQIHEYTGTNDEDDLYVGANLPWNDNGPSSCVSLTDTSDNVIDYVPWNGYESAGNPAVPKHAWSGKLQQSSGTDNIYRISDVDTNDAKDWKLGPASGATPKSLNPGQTGIGTGGVPPFTGKNLALDAVASHSSGGSGVWGPDRLNNGDKIGTYNDCWTSGGGWVQLDWSKKVTVGSMIVWYTRYRNLSPSYCLHTCEVQWWDGSSWQTDQKLDDKSYSTNNDHYIIMTKPRETTRIRLYNMWSGSNVMIQEWEVFGGSGGGSAGWGIYGPGYHKVDAPVETVVPDDHPLSGTDWDKVNIKVYIRDDDHNVYIPNPELPGLISYWAFDEGSGSVAQDLISGNDGTIYGATYVDGKYNKALSFDGSYDYIMVGNKKSLEPESFTINFWAKVTTPSRSLNGGIAKGYVFGSGTMFTYKIDFHNGEVRASVSNTGDTYNTVKYPIGDNNWHMWSFTFTKHNISLYKDAVLINWTKFVGVIDYTKSYNDFMIGSRGGGQYSLEGLMDEVAFFGRALNLSQIQNIYSKGIKVRFTDGIDSCSQNINVYNVPPKIDLNRTFTDPDIVKEQENFIFHSEFEDPAADVSTESFEYKITWGNGEDSGWKSVTRVKPGKPAGLTELEIQPGPDEGKDAYAYSYSSYVNYNYGRYSYVYVGGYTPNYVRKGLIQWDLGWVPKGIKLTDATMKLYFYSRYHYQSEKMHWYPIIEPWKEGTKTGSAATPGEVTWNNLPKFDNTKAISSIDWASGGGWVEFSLDLTTVQSWIDNPETNYGMMSQFDDEDSSDSNYGYFYSSDYSTASLRPELVLGFEKPLPAILSRGIIEETYMYPDDHPETGTPWDKFDITIDVRDDDLGTDHVDTNITVHNVPPEISEGTFYVMNDSPWTLGKFGAGLKFDGEDNYVRINYDESLNITKEITIEAWIYPTNSDTKEHMIISKGGNWAYSDCQEYELTMDKDRPLIQTKDANTDFWYGAAPADPITKNRWHHVAGIYDGTSFSIYIDGVKQTKLFTGWDVNYKGEYYSGGLPTGTHDISIGRREPATWGALYFEGKIDEVVIFNRVLSSLEIQKHYISGVSDSENAKGLWKFDEGFGTNASDSSGNNNHGTIYGSYLSTKVEPGELTGEGINEGTLLTLEGFKFNDVAYSVPTEFDYGFNYSIDWGDGTPPTPWMNDFSYTSNAGEFFMVESGTYSSATRYNNGRKLVMDSKGTMYTTYFDYPSPYDIYISVSDDLGENWNEYKISTDSLSTSYQYNPAIAIDSNDELHVVWYGYATGYYSYNIRYASSTDGGKTWGNFTMVTTGTSSPNTHYAPSIAVDSKDTIHIVWYGRDTTNTASYNIRYRSRKVDGTWSGITLVTTDTTSRYHYYPSVAVDSKDNVHVVWRGRLPTTTRYNIQYRKLDSSTNTWGSIVYITSSTTEYNYNPSIAVDKADNIHVAWYGYPSPYKIKYIKWDSATSSWGSVEIVSSNSYSNYYPSIGIDQRGYLYVAWYTTSPYEIWMSINDGGGWSDEIEITLPSMFTSTTYYPSIMYGSKSSIAPQGVCLVFSANVGGYKIYWTTSPDFYMGEAGPKRGIPSFSHLYPDDNPSHTDQDIYNLTISVRDDDTGIGKYVLPIRVNNIWPMLDKSDLQTEVTGEENALYLPPIDFVDPGTGMDEDWWYWVDADLSETWTIGDICGQLVTDLPELALKKFDFGDAPDKGMISPTSHILSGYPSLLASNGARHITVDSAFFGRNVDEEVDSHQVDLDNYDDGLISFTTNELKFGVTNKNFGSNLNVNILIDYNYDGDWGDPISGPDTGEWVVKNLPISVPMNSYQTFSVNINRPARTTWMRMTLSADSPSDYIGMGIFKIGETEDYLLHEPRGLEFDDTWTKTTPVALDIKNIDNVTYGTISPIKIPFNDDYEHQIQVYIYDDDVPIDSTYVNINYSYIQPDGDEGKDSWVKNDGLYDNDNYGAARNIRVGERSGQPGDHRAYIEFNLTSIPKGTYIRSAKLQLFNYGCTETEAKNIGAYKCVYTYNKHGLGAYQTPWVEGTTTNDARLDGIVWNGVFQSWSWPQYTQPNVDTTTDYGNGPNGLIDEVTITSVVNDWVSWDITQVVREWVNGTSPNYGLRLKHDEEGSPYGGPYYGRDKLFYSSESDETNWVSRPNYKKGDNYRPRLLLSAEGLEKIYERTDYNAKFNVTTLNVPPRIICPLVVDFLPDEDMKLPIQFVDQGSDDLYCLVDWGDGAVTGVKKYYNNGQTPEPMYLPTHSACNGTAPFMIKPDFYHKYFSPGKYRINVTLWDDDQWVNGQNGTKVTIIADVLTPHKMKERAIELLEPLIPGRLDWVGYETLTIKYHDTIDPTLLVYNHISRPPYYWETKLFMSFCNVKQNDTIFINGSYLDQGMFGTKLILKLYNESRGVLDVTEISTVYTCLEPLKVGQRYGPWEIMDFTKKSGITYHHYSRFALTTEDALDHVLRSINRDPRRGYGWWHQYWAWWCGYTYYRGLWIDDMHLDPQFGLVVFCEERAAVLNLMEVIKNCLNPEGVVDITFKYGGKVTVDVEIYILQDFWWGGWKWFDAAYDLKPGESFKIDGSILNDSKLPDRIMMRVYHAHTGKILDTIYLRTSGEWFLEVEPGNKYGDFNITDSTLLLGNSTEWDTWWGGDMDWWDWFFGFWYWENEKFRSSNSSIGGCGWEPDECFDSDAAREEKQRICSNLTIIKQIINMLVKADDMLARVVYLEAQNTTVMDASYQDEYMYHFKWSKRYWWRGYDNFKKGRPHRAINDFKTSWKYAILAMKWALKGPGAPIPGSDMHNPCGDCPDQTDECGNSECEPQVNYPWWMWWYLTECTFKNNCQYRCDHCGNWCYC